MENGKLEIIGAARAGITLISDLIPLIADLIRDLLRKDTDEIPARWPE